MNLFDQLVTQALQNCPDLSSLRIVVEKELLHHDILRILSQNNFLIDLTFIGGTCLRSCYNAERLSEDLDFTGGLSFDSKRMLNMGQILQDLLFEKYGLEVVVREPKPTQSNVDTWKVSIITRPQQKDIPAQRINIDICRVPSYERRPILLINHYGVAMASNGLILYAQSLEEIYTDKILAFALRPNRLKYRDLWDILWLHQKGIEARLSLISNKLQDRKLQYKEFHDRLVERQNNLNNEQHKHDFKKEMQRFLPTATVEQFINQTGLWEFLVAHMGDLSNKIHDIS